jgi:adenosylcobyric acid synthase
MRAEGLDQAVRAHAAGGGAVLGLCGGLQILGGRMDDPHGVDGTGEGLGLLPLRTRFEHQKLLRHTRARFADLRGAWDALGGLSFEGYEIRHGHTWPDSSDGADTTIVALRNESGDPIGWQRDNVLGVYAHGLFESPAAMGALFGAASRTFETVFEGLADFIDAHFHAGVLESLIRPPLSDR